MLISNFRDLGSVTLPPYGGRQKYMHGFDVSAPSMAAGFEDYLPAVSALIERSRAKTGTAYMTVDEKVVSAGMSQRRPGPHVDGCFIPALNDWSHHPSPGWNHYCNTVPIARMPIIVASSVAGCKVWNGSFAAAPRNDGDLSHAESLLGEGEMLEPHRGYLLSPDCVHESLRFAQDTKRTFLRIALPVGSYAV